MIGHRPGSDHSVEAIYDREKREFVSFRVIDHQRAENKRMSDTADEIVFWAYFARSRGIKDPEQYFPNPSGIDDQGEAQVVDP